MESIVESSLLWVCAMMQVLVVFPTFSYDRHAEFPLYITVELVDWRNERWVCRTLFRLSQPVSIRLEQFKSPGRTTTLVSKHFGYSGKQDGEEFR